MTASEKKFMFWLATTSASQFFPMVHGSLIMSLKPDLEQMTRKALRAYVLSHRDDEEALRFYIDRLHTDPDVIRHTGSFNQQGTTQLEHLIQQQAQRTIDE
jgi:hypothetical protein